MSVLTKSIRSRNSALECLRIIAMFLVLLGHYLPFREQPSYLLSYDKPLETLFDLALNSISFICVNVFILVSGYFGIKPKRKSFIHLISQIVFWGLFCTIVGAFIWPSEFKVPNIILNIITIFRQWFVFCYLGLYLMAPVLNSYLESISTNKLRKFVLIYWSFSLFFGYFCYGFWGTPKDFLEGMSILSLIGLYFLGAYLNREISMGNRYFSLPSWYYLVAYLMLCLLQTIFAYILLRYNVKSSPYGYMNPIILLESICFFLFFARLKMKTSYIINYISSSVFAVYLFHCSPAFGNHFNDSFKWIETNFELSFPIACLYLIIIFIVGIAIDKIWLMSISIYKKYRDLL